MLVPMKRTKPKRESDARMLDRIKKEMSMPRLAESVRSAGRKSPTART